jgi:hypothetical protein
MCAMQWAIWRENKVLASMVFNTQCLAKIVLTAMEYRKTTTTLLADGDFELKDS